ncbi:G patch domain and KOW motifs-containing protein-like [Mizuhopecten yessoensis]|uniref:G patch domain and KOW motifs-containing protein n=1 Tax=Mizuhopecten yessoensis TaxID=6573 RepID=A0A210Q916_MIZYE|nr:G patch domain and KOW motifs-containing protein-like [Mizuhopecten yessoensis]OWF45237.1 G patch domain and KOW motifs-containing protein [Mizuhopecten yessoensis]
MAERKALSFGFSKKVNSRPLEKSKLQEDNETASDQHPDFVTSLEGREVKGSSKPKEIKQKEYVIPLISKNKWRLPGADRNRVSNTDQTDVKAVQEKERGRPDSNGTPQEPGIDDQAVQELIQDAAKQNDGWEDRGKIDPNVSIPLIMRNKVPEGYETDDKLNVALRPDEVDVDYDEIPIDHFGVAMLRGMGWKDGEGIGKSKQTIVPIEAKLRPKGLGLGADRSKAAQLNNAKAGGTDNGDQDDDQLAIKIGAYCMIQRGPHQDRYGEIKGLDEDNARCMVKLAVSGLMITNSQHSLKLVTKKEYSKYSKYLNKSKVDKYKEEQENKSQGHESGSHRHKKDRHDKEDRRNKKDRERHQHRDDQRNREDGRKDRWKEDRDNRDQGSDVETDRGNQRLHEDRHGSRNHRLQEDEHRRERKRDRDNRDHQDTSDSKKKKHKEDRSYCQDQYGSSNGHKESSPASFWICPQLRVRVIDDKYKKGKYLNTKVEVIDVPGPDNCVCRTDDGHVLEGLSQEMLETVIPKSEPSFVQLVTGKWKGQLAELMKRDKSNCMALVQLLRNRDEVLKISYDSICEYVGDINAEFDY